MNDIKALFLAVVMTKNKKIMVDLEGVANNEGISEELINSYRIQANTNLQLMSLTLITKISKKQEAKSHLEDLLQKIKSSTTEFDEKEFGWVLR